MVQQRRLAPSAPRLALPRAPREPGGILRATARLRWFSLDARLAAGEDPAGSRLLAAQAARLTAPRHREHLAAAIGGLLLAAELPPRRSRVSPDRGALRRNEGSLRELARRVDSREALYARGLARLERLLSDSTGPAFGGRPGDLSAELSRVEAELRGLPSGPPPRRHAARRTPRGLPVVRLARLRARRGPGPAPAPPGFHRGVEPGSC